MLLLGGSFPCQLCILALLVGVGVVVVVVYTSGQTGTESTSPILLCGACSVCELPLSESPLSPAHSLVA